MKKPILFFVLLLSLNFLFSQIWEPMAPLPGGASDARHHPVTFSSGGYGYLVTGTISGIPDNLPTQDFMRYDPATDSWQRLPDFPGIARSFSYGTSRGTKAYVGFGGFGGAAYNDLWEYDTETEQWTELTDCPCRPRFHPAFVQLDDKIYVGMGNGGGNFKDWWEYDIPTDTWTQKPDLPGLSRHHPFYFGIDSIAYVGFGHGNNVGGVTQIYKDFYKFDPSTDQWTQLNDFPGEARVAGTQFDYNGKGYVLSGDGDDHSFMQQGEFWEYTPQTDTWRPLNPHPGTSSRWAPGSFVIDNYVYFMCGLSDVQLENDMMRFQLGPPPTSIDELSSSPITVFPNPANAVITIGDDITQFSTLRLMNKHGQVVKRIKQNQVEVADLPNGMYYLQFFKNESMYTQKIMIIH